MSSTFFSATATCQASLNFSLESYIKTLAENIIKNLEHYEDSIHYEVEGYDADEFADKLSRYISCSQYSRVNEIEIKMDSEEDNGSGELFDLLAKSIREDVMESKVMEVYSCSFDTRAGMRAYHYYIAKSGREITPDRMIELIESSNFVD